MKIIGERDTLRGSTIENRGYFVCLYMCVDVRMSSCFEPRVFLC